MSSPPDSTTDIDEIALNKKRGRAQSVEPAPLQEIDDEHLPSQETSNTTVSAPKKTKRDEEDPNTTTTVNTIRKNMKDMTTTDKNLSESKSTASSISQDEDEDADEPMASSAENKPFTSQFGGGSKRKDDDNDNDNDDDWEEFAQDDEEDEQKDASKKDQDEKPKYTFGSSSGFGTKGWATTHQTIPIPSNQTTFSGFGATSGFGGFKTSPSSHPAENKTATSVPTFGSFAKATASPFATAAKAGNVFSATAPPTSTHVDSSTSSFGNTNPSTTATATTTTTTTTTTTAAATTAVTEFQGHHHNGSESDGSQGQQQQQQQQQQQGDNPATASAVFGERARTQASVTSSPRILTGEEDEETIYQTKAKLLVLDTASGNWKERGVGTLRINVKEKEPKKQLRTRLVMRVDSVYRVILNLQLFPGMKAFIMQDKFVRFAGFETEVDQDGVTGTRLVSFALKLSNPSVAKEVCEQIISCIPPSSDDESKA
ncbi:hypothetical protein BD408DRAFT_446621 [Parasitella parasitica]|nr:hypothetical protein BD408DRAFT_446621 [Parasitella parasitica]